MQVQLPCYEHNSLSPLTLHRPSLLQPFPALHMAFARFTNLGEMMNLGGLDGAVTTLGGRVKLSGKAAGLARRAVYAVSF